MGVELDRRQQIQQHFTNKSMNEKRQAQRKFHLQAGDVGLEVSSEFDSGNLEECKVREHRVEEGQAEVELQLWPASEPFNSHYSLKPSSKAFFHFKIKSNACVTLHAHMHRMNILSYLQSSMEYYSLCMGQQTHTFKEPTYHKIKPSFLQYHKTDQHVLEWKQSLQPGLWYYFAYHYPYSYERLKGFEGDLREEVEKMNERNSKGGNPDIIYFRKQLLIESVEGRQVSLLTLTQTSKKALSSLPLEERISKSLFPYYELECRPHKFSKPIVMLTCRVHPGETSSSFMLEGFLKHLVSDAPEAEFLRRMFVVLVVPLVNPDGVFHGTYRMDMQGHNLNRFYNACLSHKQPSIFAIQLLIQHHSEDLYVFFDVHSHPQLKGSYFYGNTYGSLIEQTESQVFAKLLAVNSECFSYEHSSFTEKNMSSKDANELMTKDGSARVFAHRKMPANVHCYTIEMGYHGAGIKKQPTEHRYKPAYRRLTKQFHVKDYEEHGVALLHTLTQVFAESCRTEPKYDPIVNMREEISRELYEKDEKYRMMDNGLSKKVKNINSHIQNQIYLRMMKKYPQICQCVKWYDEKTFTPYQHHDIHDIHYHSVNEKKKHSLEGDYTSLSLEKHFLKHNGRIERLKERMNLIPVEFTLPNPDPPIKRSKSKHMSLVEPTQNNLVNIHFNPKLKMEKKKFNKLLEKNKAQRNISSSLNHKHIYHKLTIQTQNIDTLLYCQQLLNQENQEIQAHPINQSRQFHINHPDERAGLDQDKTKKEQNQSYLKSYQTERLSRRYHLRERKLSKEKATEKTNINLPKIEKKTDRNSKYQLELKIKEKYDKQIVFDEKLKLQKETIANISNK